jgi:hypothetical protein
MVRIRKSTWSTGEEPGLHSCKHVPPVSILCPTAFNTLRFPKLFQRFRRAIRAGVNVSKLLLRLPILVFGNHFCEITLNQEDETQSPTPFFQDQRRPNDTRIQGSRLAVRILSPQLPRR